MVPPPQPPTSDLPTTDLPADQSTDAPTDTATSPRQQQQTLVSSRQRIKQACTACKTRKRKCDGRQPCSMCQRYEYECSYEETPRKRRKAGNHTTSTSGLRSAGNDGTATGGTSTAAGVNAGGGVNVGTGEEGSTTTSSVASPSIRGSSVTATAATTGRSGLRGSTSNTTGLLFDSNQEASAGSGGTGVTASQPMKAERDRINRMEALSSYAFAKMLGMRLDPAGRFKLTNFAWNLGLDSEPTVPNASFQFLMARDDGLKMASKYFDFYFLNVHSPYRFMDWKFFEEKVKERWTTKRNVEKDAYDPIICLVAALGSLYSGNEYPSLGLERELVACAKRELDASLTKEPNLETCQAWLLMLLYVRTTGSAHAAWVCSGIEMMLIEACGLHQEPENTSVLYPGVPTASEHELDIRRRVYWLSRVLNSWISFSYGRSRVAIRSPHVRLPSQMPGENFLELVELYRIAERLDPEKVVTTEDLEGVLETVEALQIHHPVAVLSLANVYLSIFQRLRAVKPLLCKNKHSAFIAGMKKGITATHQLVEANQPWWHTAFIPFQFICALLAMDARESMVELPDALKTLEKVAAHWRTPAMYDALNTAKVLVSLTKKRKEDDLALLNQGLEELEDVNVQAGPGEEEASLQFGGQGQGQGQGMYQFPLMAGHMGMVMQGGIGGQQGLQGLQGVQSVGDVYSVDWDELLFEGGFTGYEGAPGS